MSHSRVHSPVDRPVWLLAAFLPLLFLLGGCSVFGIATKGNLEDLSEQQELRYQEQQAELQQISRQLVAVESNLQASLDEMASQNRQRDADVAAMRGNMEAAQRQVQAVLSDLAVLVSEVGVARAESRSAIKMQQDDIYSERVRLQQRLVELDEQIRLWQEENPTAAQQTDPIIMQSLVPEKPETVLKAPGRNDAAQATSQSADETSVWDRNR